MKFDNDLRYASHQPVLRKLGVRADMQRIIEFGVGPSSTPLFLDSAAFPHLVHMVSVESEHEWELWAFSKFRGCQKFSLIFADAHAQRLIEFGSNYDLCLVDSMTQQMRLHTLMQMRWKARLVVLHDAENAGYERAVECYKFVRMHKPEGLPWTAVMSNLEEVE